MIHWRRLLATACLALIAAPVLAIDYRSVDVPADPDKVTALRVFVTLPREKLAEAAEGFRIVAEDRQGHERDVYSAKFNTPGAK